VPGVAKTVSDEDRVKAAFVFNFVKFVDWPDTAFPDPGKPLRICVWRKKPETGILDSLHEKIAKQRPIEVRYTQDIARLGDCHVLYMTKDSRGTFKGVIPRIAGKSILTVSDIDEFAQNGGMIGLFKSENQIRFAINVKATQRSGLRMSSQLLKFGTIVKGEDK